ncbi:zinc finger, C3HC4 type [Dictyocaulus viviparus]|uniref:Zinc finger, C3HC4 type n=1 Tax=Dictyocaulus viviparus TaxID=29172 RepID=A0A0D8YAJ8_DICVI|nr:zinc finger, C3HC4 type [Dictyocaulus viviparus]
MTSPVKKSKKKCVEDYCDYSCVIPENLNEKSQTVVEKLLEESIPEELRRQALMLFNETVESEEQFVDVNQVALTNGYTSKEELLMKQSTSSETVVKSLPLAAESASSLSSGVKEFCPADDRQRINVGWMAGPSDAKEEYDHKIAVYSQHLGCQHYNFVSYPAGGVRRGFWKPTRGSCPPPIDLPDVQLQNHLWETYVNAQISSWIDCDSDDEEIAVMSEIELQKELNYIAYMGMRSAVIRLKHADSPRLARILNQWLWTKNVNLSLWILIPTRIEEFIRSPNDTRDCWTIWADFRQLCSNFYCQKLIAGLHLTPDIDDEFVDKKLVSRWKAEPLATFCVDVDVFIQCEGSGHLCLPPAHANLLNDLWMSDKGRIMVRGTQEYETTPETQLQCAQALRAVVRDANDRPKGITLSSFLVESNISYVDVLQVPLQPLADNLDSCVYNTFEQDPVKYKRYREAIEFAIRDYGESSSRPEHLVLYVLGAGRGPLRTLSKLEVTCSIEAERNYNARFRCKRDRLCLEIYVVEKNVNAVVTLKYMNQHVWRNRCVIVESDMRDIPSLATEKGYPKPDIIVSELLGSFGDNELSPECLDGVTPFLKPSTISIPQTYTSYVAPIMSLNIHQQIKMSGASYWNRGIPGHGRNGSTLQSDGTYRQSYPQGAYISNMDQIYVAYLRQYCALADPKPLFTFNHPNFINHSNARSSCVSFEIDRPADVMGFAGYFHMILYKDVFLSIVPSTYSEGMISWFPALIPLRELHRVLRGDKISLNIDRKVDETGVWYEWYIHHTTAEGNHYATPLQNKNGERSLYVLNMLTTSSICRVFVAEVRLLTYASSRKFGRKQPPQGKPPILPPSKKVVRIIRLDSRSNEVVHKVLYNVVHVPWQSPEDVKELLWRRHVYNNAVMSLREVFRKEIEQEKTAGKGLEAMKEEENEEFNRLIEENDRINLERAEARAKREETEWKITQNEILKEIDEALQKEQKLADEASAEVRAAIARSRNFVDETNLEAKILEALENPKVYDFAIDRQGNKYYDPLPMKYQEGIDCSIRIIPMQSYIAEVSEMVRAQRRDEEEIDSLRDRISWVVKELLGQRAWIQVYPYIRPLAMVAYYSCTTLAGVQTLGEEYVKIFATHSTFQTIPSFETRFLFVFFHAIAPLLTQLSIQKAQRVLAHPSTSSFMGVSIKNNPKARKSFENLLEWIRSGIPHLHRIHLAFFYIFGAYYNISRRLTGIRFLSLSPQSNLKALKIYRFLGYLTLAHTAVSLIPLLASFVAKRTSQATIANETKQNGTIQKGISEEFDDFPHAWFHCPLCLEYRSPSAIFCGHLFCWKCIHEHALSEDVPRCPICRAPYKPSQVVPLLNL